MAKYILLAMVKDNGQYKAGDVVSIREPGARVTALEEKTFACVESEHTQEEIDIFMSKRNPHHKIAFPARPVDGKNFDEETYNTELAKAQAEADKTPVCGVKLNLSHIEIVSRLADLQDRKKRVPVFDIDKTAILIK